MNDPVAAYFEKLPQIYKCQFVRKACDANFCFSKAPDTGVRIGWRVGGTIARFRSWHRWRNIDYRRMRKPAEP
jgi:hypothetical protein